MVKAKLNDESIHRISHQDFNSIAFIGFIFATFCVMEQVLQFFYKNEQSYKKKRLIFTPNFKNKRSIILASTKEQSLKFPIKNKYLQLMY